MIRGLADVLAAIAATAPWYVITLIQDDIVGSATVDSRFVMAARSSEGSDTHRRRRTYETSGGD